MTYDVIVVGAGPGGATTALLLSERGLRVLVLDRAAFPRPKICGEYLSPEAARILDRIGALKAVDAAGAVALEGMTITAPDGTRLVGSYPTTGPWRGYRDHALAVPRLVLDAVLVDRLHATSVDLQERCRVTDLALDGRRVRGVHALDADGRPLTFHGRLVIGADGRNSIVARRLGLVSAHRLRRMALMTYIRGPFAHADRGEIFVDPPDYCILNPVAPERANLSLVVPLADAAAHRGRLDAFFEARLGRLTLAAPRLSDLRRDAPVVALGPLAYRVARPRHDGVLLVGDAAGFYDPFTGEGVYTALRSAELAADVAVSALEAGDASAIALGRYWRARRAAFHGKDLVTRGLQTVIRTRALANAVAHHLHRRPGALDLLMGVIGDFVPPRVLLRPRILSSLLGLT